MVLVFVWPKPPPPRPPLLVAVLMLLLFLLPVILIPLADGFFVKPKETGFSFVELLVPPSFKVVVFEEGGLNVELIDIIVWSLLSLSMMDISLL